MVAEKPSICTAIATALAKDREMQQTQRNPPVYEFEGTFKGQTCLFRVTSVTGHVFSTDFPAAYQNWDAIDPVDLFSAPVISVAEKGGVVKSLEREARNMDYLVLWLDCDREGENICFEVIRVVSGHMNKGTVSGQKIFRAKFSAVTPKDIEKAMTCLVEPNENESKAVDARQELDLKVGVAFSRFQTRFFQGRYGDLDSSVISYGPCQTPTLGFCVDRHDEIQTFTPETFWSLDVSIDPGKGYPIVALEWSRGRVFEQATAEMFHTLLKKETSLVCTSRSESETRKQRPKPLNTVELLKLASKVLGIGPHAAMRAAEHLYLSGYLSYPRTESTSYPSSFDIREALSIQRNNPEYGGFARDLLTNGFQKPLQGVDVGDHPPITPVGLAYGLSGDNARIYDLVVRHFLATVSGDAIFMTTKLTFQTTGTAGVSGGDGASSSSPTSVVVPIKETFTVTGKREIEPGFTAVYGTTRDAEVQDLPDIASGAIVRIAANKMRTGTTSPPGYLTESELIGLMEKHGIGTDASIPTHINNIIVRNYVTLGNGRTLVPTALGIVLVHGYKRIDPDLVLPNVRAAIETFCNAIAKGEATKEAVVEHSLRNFENKFRFFCAHIGMMDTLFESSFSPLAATGKFLSKCGKCSRYMRYIPLKPQRLYCPTCEETHSLPQNGTIKLYKELRCPLDNFELVLFSLGNSTTSQGKSYPLCPFCYNHPPQFDDIEDEGDNEGEDEMESGVTGHEGVADGKDSKEPSSASASSSTSKGKEEEDEKGGGSNLAMGKMGCNECTHPTCKHSATFNEMGACPSIGNNGTPCGGSLILDVNSKPNWKLACNRCNTLLRFHADIHNISPCQRQNCAECGSRIAIFEFNKLRTPLPNGETKVKGCIVCNDLLNGLTEMITGRSINIKLVRQMRYKRGAGGRGGRGRGRRKVGDPKMSFEDF